VRFGAASFAGAGVVLLVAMAGFATLSLAGGALTMILRRANPLNLVIASTSLIAGGVLYPRGILPHPLRWAGALLPITPALDGLRAAIVHGQGPLQLGGPLLRLAAFALLGGPLAAWLFTRSLARARQDGSLTSY
jgi:ABC-type polysaccharide/polyol phosphate export permease